MNSLTRKTVSLLAIALLILSTAVFLSGCKTDTGGNGDGTATPPNGNGYETTPPNGDGYETIPPKEGNGMGTTPPADGETAPGTMPDGETQPPPPSNGEAQDDEFNLQRGRGQDI